MPDYGHDLAFGTFLTPAEPAPRRRRRARAAHRARRPRPRHVPGPPVPARVPRHLDAADVGRRADGDAAASRPNVLNLPLRPPAVLARAAASLDLLSGGRFELGLGAGAFWDAIEAMGGPRRTPGEAVDALERGDRRHPRHLGHRRARRRARRRRALPGQGRQARAGARARHRDLARRLQAADAAADRPQGRRLAAVAGVPAARATSRAANAHDRRGGRRRPAATRARSAAC